MLETRLTCSLVTKLPLHSSLAVREFRIAIEECYKRAEATDEYVWNFAARCHDA